MYKTSITVPFVCGNKDSGMNAIELLSDMRVKTFLVNHSEDTDIIGVEFDKEANTATVVVK